MYVYVAPMEGVTGAVFRRVHHALFPGVARYYMPFVSPTQNHRFTPREVRELHPEHHGQAPAVPQLLTRSVPDFLWAASALADLGYDEVNLNLGCPSGTVVAKGKGSGFLGRREELAEFLDQVCARSPLPVSVKTRVGLHSEDEFPALLELYNRYPLQTVIVHPRIQGDFYRGPVHLAAFGLAAEHCRHPLCYNGDVRTPGDFQCLTARFPQLSSVMLGRGIITDPALAQRLNGGAGADRDTLIQFHHQLYEGYCAALGSRPIAMLRMKEFWSYFIGLFQDGEDLCKHLRKSGGYQEYQQWAHRILTTLPLRDDPAHGLSQNFERNLL